AVGCSGGGLQNQTPGGYANQTTINEGPWCLTDGNTYDIISIDDWGDGGIDFEVQIATFPLYTFSSTTTNETFSFVANPPPAIDGAMLHVETPTYVYMGNVDVKGKIKNQGSTVINSMDVNYTIILGTTITQNLSSLNIAPFTTFSFTHPTPWYPSAAGAYTLDLWISNINGQGADAVPSNDNLTKTINIINPISNIIPSYASLTNTFTYEVIGNSSDQVSTPRDLDFHPNGDLWTINKGTENSGGSTVKFTNPGATGQTSLWQQDGNAWHFMSLPSGIAFSNNGNFATSTSVYDANHNGGAPFAGPTLWSSDPAIYAQPSGGNGSHLDMLHESSYCMGIASESENVFWVFDANNNDIVRYDFGEDHGPGNDDHDNGKVRRYPQPAVNWINADISSHLVIDRNTEWLYIVDGGNQRILRLDINSGTVGGTPNYPQYDAVLAEYTNVTGVTWEVVVSTGLIQPSGIDIVEGYMIVSDYSNGDIVIYNILSTPVTETGRLQTNDPGIMGLVIGPQGRIWYANATQNKIVKIEPNQIIISVEELINDENLLIYPNPTNSIVTIEHKIEANHKSSVYLVDVSGKEIFRRDNLSGTKNTFNFSDLSNGLYFLTLNNGINKFTEKLIIKH
ncbi:MAG TPA: T9SS type A sorting domain-containing protein, partial [Flavobacteriales bacterium]|nr:T9SS type A sorting domain-containing protein [Flavobacteriales bacterium]